MWRAFDYILKHFIFIHFYSFKNWTGCFCVYILQCVSFIFFWCEFIPFWVLFSLHPFRYNSLRVTFAWFKRGKVRVSGKIIQSNRRHQHWFFLRLNEVMGERKGNQEEKENSFWCILYLPSVINLSEKRSRMNNTSRKWILRAKFNYCDEMKMKRKFNSNDLYLIFFFSASFFFYCLL